MHRAFIFGVTPTFSDVYIFKPKFNFNIFFMKTKLLLLLAMSIGLVSSAWAEDVEISNADELAAFAERVNGGEFDLNAVLTDNINMSE